MRGRGSNGSIAFIYNKRNFESDGYSANEGVVLRGNWWKQLCRWILVGFGLMEEDGGETD